MRVGYHFGNLESFINLILGASCDGFLDEHSDSREVLQDLYFEVSTRLQRPAVHGRCADDDSSWPVARAHVSHELVKRFEYTRALVRRHHE